MQGRKIERKKSRIWKGGKQIKQDERKEIKKDRIKELKKKGRMKGRQKEWKIILEKGEINGKN